MRVLGFLFFFCFSHANAAVVVETSQALAVEGVKDAIIAGAWDSYQLNINVEKDGKVTAQAISAKAFQTLSPEDQTALAMRLAHYYNGESNASFNVWVGTQLNDLKNEPAMVRLGVPFETLKVSEWAETLLSAYAKRWAKKWSEFNGPNCYHTSVASIFTEWTTPRYMGPNELLCHQRTYFDEIEKPELWGDMVSLNDSAGIPIHAFTYLGVERDKTGRRMVFTKNGYRVSPFLFMTYDEVVRIYQSFGIAHIRFYRPKAAAKALDPKTHTDAPCYSYFSSGSWKKERQIGDALLEYRLKTEPLSKLAPVKLP